MPPIRKQRQSIAEYQDLDLIELKRWWRNGHFLRYSRSNQGVISRTKHAAKRRNIEYNLPKAYALNLLESPCFYCKIHRSKHGIDRVNNNVGYIIGNCAPACKWCNNAKATMTLQEFKQWIKDIRKFI